MLSKLKLFFKNSSAVASIEFALGSLPFIMLIAAVFNVIFGVYQDMAITYANSNAARFAASFTYKDGYKDHYENALKTELNGVLFFADKKNLTSKLSFCKDLDEVIKLECTADAQTSIATIYELNYLRKPFMYNFFSDERSFHSLVLLFNEINYQNEELIHE